MTWRGGPMPVSIDGSRKEIEAELERLHAREVNLENLVEGSIQGILILSREEGNRPLFANRAATEILGYGDAAEIVSLPSDDRFVAPDELQRLRRMSAARLKGEDAPSIYDTKFIRTDGATIPCQVMVTLIDWDRQPAILVAFVDTSQRHRAEEAQHASEARFRNLIEGSIQGFHVVDKDWNILFANQAVADILGYEAPDEIVALKSAAELVAPEDRERVRGYSDDRIVGKDAPARHQFWGLRKDGSPLWLEGLVKVVDWDGTPAVLVSLVDIDERKRIEAELRDSEERFRRAFEDAGVGVLMLELDGRFQWINRAFRDMLGYSEDEILDKTFADVTYPGDLEIGHEVLREMIAGERQTAYLEKRYVHKAGHTVHASLSASVVRDVEGVPLYTVAHVQDISERKRAETALQASEERFRDFAGASSDWFWEMGENLRFSYFSERFTSIAGIAPDNLLGRTRGESGVKESVGPEAWREHLDDLHNHRPFRNFEHSRTKPNGEMVWLSISGTPIFDEGGAFKGYRGNGSDITERIRSEEERRESEVKLHTILDNTPLLITLKDVEGRYVSVNKRWAESWGLTEEEAKGKTVHDILPPEFAASLWQMEQQVIEEKTTATEEHQEPTDSGIRNFFEVIFPLFDASGVVTGIGTIATDVTESKRLDEQLRQAQKMEAVGQLTGGVAHDFNNLLAVIQGNLELLGEVEELEPAARDLADRAMAAAERGATLTKRLLSFSRQQALQPRAIDLGELVTDMRELLSRSVEENIEIETELGTKAWPAAVDAGQLESVILNLAINARDAMPDGGRLTFETSNVTITEERGNVGPELAPGDYAVLTVHDTGRGMTSEVASRAFDPFFTTKPAGEGSGLGLSMAYGFITQSGGHIDLASEVDGGTQIRIFLPRAGAEATAPAEDLAYGPVPRGHGERVLVVEDDAEMRRLALDMLTNLGYATIEAMDGPSALAAVENDADIALLLSDLVLPGGMSGLEIAQAAQRRRPELPVILMSGYADLGAVEISDSYQLIRKPFRMAAFARTLRATLERKN